ncbi:hypothetical protein [Neisseria musculi]
MVRNEGVSPKGRAPAGGFHTGPTTARYRGQRPSENSPMSESGKNEARQKDAESSQD